jgi:hypothetical protein
VGSPGESTTGFLDTFREFLGRHGRPADLSPWGVVEAWEQLVDDALEGYHGNIYEWSNDLSGRDLLEEAFHDPALARYEPVPLMRERVAAADERFRAALLPGVDVGTADEPWWHRGVLAAAGEEYAEDVERRYGIEVRVVA